MQRVSLFVFLTLFAAQVFASGLDQKDRQRLIAHLEMTGQWLADETRGLSEGQLKFRTEPNTWSVLDCVEHLTTAEPQYWDDFQKGMKSAPSTQKPQATDAAILWYGIDRTQKAKTGEARVPKGRWDRLESALAAFRGLRLTMLVYARDTEDDMRGHLLFEGNQDAYQWFLMISTHAQRHILQIREIKSNPGFPKQ